MSMFMPRFWKYVSQPPVKILEIDETDNQNHTEPVVLETPRFMAVVWGAGGHGDGPTTIVQLDGNGKSSAWNQGIKRGGFGSLWVLVHLKLLALWVGLHMTGCNSYSCRLLCYLWATGQIARAECLEFRTPRLGSGGLCCDLRQVLDSYGCCCHHSLRLPHFVLQAT